MQVCHIIYHIKTHIDCSNHVQSEVIGNVTSKAEASTAESQGWSRFAAGSAVRCTNSPSAL